MKNPKNIINEIIYFSIITFQLFLATFLVSGLFYIRFLPRVSRDLWQNMTNYQLFLTLFILLCIILNIYNTLKIMGYIKTKEPSAVIKTILDSLQKIVNYIYLILTDLYHFFWFILEKLVNIFVTDSCIHYVILKPLVKSFTNPKYSSYYFVVLISLKIIPRIIFVSALVYDVIICQHFDYTFRCIPLLLIPLLENVFIFMMRHFYNCHIEGLMSFLIITPISGTTRSNYSLKIPEKDLPYGAKDFHDFFNNHVYPVDQVLITIEKYEFWRDKKIHVDYVLLLLQTIRLFVYTFILIYGII